MTALYKKKYKWKFRFFHKEKKGGERRSGFKWTIKVVHIVINQSITKVCLSFTLLIYYTGLPNVIETLKKKVAPILCVYAFPPLLNIIH